MARQHRSEPETVRRARNETIQAALRDFARLRGVEFDGLREDQQNSLFEQFATIHILRKHVSDLEIDDLEQVSTGGVDDNQLDAVALLLNGRLIVDHADALALIELVEPIDFEIIAVQVTTSTFDRFRIKAFTLGMHTFMSDVAYYKENNRLSEMRQLKDLILRECAARDVPLRIRVRGYFAANSALPVGPTNLHKEFAQGRDVLLGVDIVDEAEVQPVEHQRLASLISRDPLAALYSTAPEPYSGYVPSAHLVRLPQSSGAGECWMGAIDYRSFLLLMTREDGISLREEAFEHNVRGYLSHTTVNRRIRDTLLSEDRFKFPLLNNGLTLVAETILESPPAVQGGGARLKLSNYQLVNGLQTAHVLHGEREHLLECGETLFLPIKLVATDDAPLQRRIVDASNRQNQIAGIALHANDPKSLEIHHLIRQREAQAGENWPMIFERRPGLPRSRPALPDAQQIDLGEALRAFVATFLDAPHRAEAGLRPTLEMVGSTVLIPADAPEAYMTASLLLAHTRRYLDRAAEAAFVHEFSPYEYHLVYALRILVEPHPSPGPRDGKKTLEYCEVLEERCLRLELMERALERATRAVRAARKRLPRSRFKRPMEAAALTRNVAVEAERQRRGG
ncbi:MAG: AIPR family protein [Pseudomonadota bacterium]